MEIKLTVLSTALVIAACQPADTGALASGSNSPATLTQGASSTGFTTGATQAVQTYQLEGLLERPTQLSAWKVEGGGHSVSLGAGFHSVVMAHKHPDGSRSIICTDSLEQPNEFLSGRARAPLEYE